MVNQDRFKKNFFWFLQSSVIYHDRNSINQNEQYTTAIRRIFIAWAYFSFLVIFIFIKLTNITFCPSFYYNT